MNYEYKLTHVIRELLNGISSFFPRTMGYIGKGSKGTASARYCYSVWMRHWVLAHENGLPTNPKVVAEIGPGNSIGLGITALLTCADTYYAFDAIPHASLETNLSILNELTTLIADKTPIPNDDEFPHIKPKLKDYSFPDHLITDEMINHRLQSNRIESIKQCMLNYNNDPKLIKYIAPWDGQQQIKCGQVDMIISQATLEHVNDLPKVYQAMSQWLKNNGFISHQIDYRSHATSKHWYGHWYHSPKIWGLFQGKRPYLINRQPHSAHIHLLKSNGFKITFEQLRNLHPPANRKLLAREFKHLTDLDLTTAGAFIQATKVASRNVDKTKTQLSAGNTQYVV